MNPARPLNLESSDGWRGKIPEFSDYVVFVDESGDHGMQNIDPQFPIFVLVFCVIVKVEYHWIVSSQHFSSSSSGTGVMMLLFSTKTKSRNRKTTSHS